MIEGLLRSSHGGCCCGMTHIWNFPSSPTVVMEARTAYDADEWAKYLTATPQHSIIYNEAHPKQTAVERLDEIIERITDNRANGIIEAVLVSEQLPYWQKTLEERGFKIVNAHLNSNSSNRLSVFHLNS